MIGLQVQLSDRLSVCEVQHRSHVCPRRCLELQHHAGKQHNRLQVRHTERWKWGTQCIAQVGMQLFALHLPDLCSLALILGQQVLEWQPGGNRSLSIPDGAAVEIYDSWEGAHSPAALHLLYCHGQAAAFQKTAGSLVLKARTGAGAGVDRQVTPLPGHSVNQQPTPASEPEASSAPAAAEAPALAEAPAAAAAPVTGEAAASGLAAEPAADLAVPAAAPNESQVSSAKAVAASGGAPAAPAPAALGGGGLQTAAGHRTAEALPSEAPRCAVQAVPCCINTVLNNYMQPCTTAGSGVQFVMCIVERERPLACNPHQKALCRKKAVKGKAGTSATPSSGFSGEGQLAGLTVPELRAMAKARSAPACAACMRPHGPVCFSPPLRRCCSLSKASLRSLKQRPFRARTVQGQGHAACSRRSLQSTYRGLD